MREFYNMEFLSIISGTKKTLSVLASLYKGCVAINNHFLVKKIEKFSEKPFDENVVDNFVKSIDIEHWEEIQDLIIHQLTQAESVIKALYERNLVDALLTKKISDGEFWRMNFVLQHLYTFDVGELIKLYDGVDCSVSLKESFSFYGLLHASGAHYVGNGALSLASVYTITEFGKKFVESIKD